MLRLDLVLLLLLLLVLQFRLRGLRVKIERTRLYKHNLYLVAFIFKAVKILKGGN